MIVSNDDPSYHNSWQRGEWIEMGEGKAKVVMADVTAVERVWSNENETKFVGKSGCASLLPPPTKSFGGNK